MKMYCGVLSVFHFLVLSAGEIFEFVLFQKYMLACDLHCIVAFFRKEACFLGVGIVFCKVQQSFVCRSDHFASLL